MSSLDGFVVGMWQICAPILPLQNTSFYISHTQAAHQNLASKLLCFCCWCEEAYDTDDKADAQIHTKHTSILPLITTEKRTSSSSSSYEGLQPPNELDKQKALLPSDKKISSSSSDYDDIYSHHSQGFYKRDLNRYRQERWPSQPCLIGKP